LQIEAGRVAPLSSVQSNTISELATSGATRSYSIRTG